MKYSQNQIHVIQYSLLTFNFFDNQIRVLAYSFPQCEPIELLATVDVLRRSGMQVDIYGKTLVQNCSQKIVIQTDIQQCDPQQYDLLVIPGGPGYPKLVEDEYAKELATYFIKNKKLAAICATPGYVLGRWGLIDNKNITTYPGCEMEESKRKRVVVDGNLITAEGPGCAIEFALKIIEIMIGKEESDKLSKGIIYK